MVSEFAHSLMPYLPLLAVLSVAAGFGAIGFSAGTERPRLWDRFGAAFVLFGLVAFGAASAGVGT